MDTVAVTGGNGRIGQAVLSDLHKSGYRTVNLSRGKSKESVSDQYVATDLLDAGDVYGALALSGADAVIHLGTVPSPTRTPAHITYKSNTVSGFHILNAATELGLEAVCLASSINVMGGAFQSEPMDVEYLPVDEAHPVTPRDPYAVGKHACEVTADGFGRKSDLTVSSIRYPRVLSEEELQSEFLDQPRDLESIEKLDPHTTRDVLFSYLHINDATEIARLAVEADYSGHERFWAVATDTTMDTPTEQLIEIYYPDADRTGTFEKHEGIIDIGKASEVLGWQPSYSWRNL